MKVNVVVSPLDTKYVNKFALIIKRQCKFSSRPLPGFDAYIICEEDAAAKYFGVRFKREGDKSEGMSMNDVAGSLFDHEGKPVLFMPRIHNIVTRPYGVAWYSRMVSKLTMPDVWADLPKFKYAVVKDEEKHSEVLRCLNSGAIAALDIESGEFNTITSASVSIWSPQHGIFTYAYDFRQSHAEFFPMWREVCEHKIAKVMQNGLYDATHLTRLNCVVNNYLWDTAGMMHAEFSELPKDLGFLAAWHLRDAKFWKDTANDDLLRYNALDAFNTLCVAMNWLRTAPDWARKNYVKSFKHVFPCVELALDGTAVDLEIKQAVSNKYIAELETLKQRIAVMTAMPDFNPNSSQQVKKLLKIWQGEEPESADKLELSHICETQPLLGTIVSQILEYRKRSKILSSYINIMLWNENRVLYALSPWGTETGRFACRKSHFYEINGEKYESYGLNFQTMPRDAKAVKAWIKADPGFLLYEMDKKQSETYCTGIISGDAKLWDTVNNSPDFHSTNCSMMFGVPFDEIYKDGKVLNKALRDTGKRVNHGANYLMQENTLVDTMGVKAVRNAQKMLKLDPKWSPRRVAAHLLNDCFHATYTGLRPWYKEVGQSVEKRGGLLPSLSGWTRFTFLKPWKYKPDLNAIVAHLPQNLSGMIVNDGFFRTWLKYSDPKVLRIKAPIHDSIFFALAEGKEHMLNEIQAEFDQPYKLSDGRLLRIPSDMSPAGQYWSDCK